MPESARVITTDAEIDAAIKRAKKYAWKDRAVVRARYMSATDMLRLVLGDGTIYSIPRQLIQGLAGVRTREKLSRIQILGHGTGLLWPLLDVSHSVAGLLNGDYGSERWMNSIKGRRSNGRPRQVNPNSSSAKVSPPTRSPGRLRDHSGKIREKSGSILVGKLRDTYGTDFLPDWKADTTLSEVRNETDMSLIEMVRQYRIGKKLPAPAKSDSRAAS